MTMDGVSVMPSLSTADVDLNSDSETPLQVDISDALSEKDKVKFTVHTKTNMADYLKNDFAVTRLHEDFVWLHDDIRGNQILRGKKEYYFKVVNSIRF